MLNFFSFDDGLTYIPILQIEAFGAEPSGDNHGGTWIKLKGGEMLHLGRAPHEIAAMLGVVLL